MTLEEKNGTLPNEISKNGVQNHTIEEKEKKLAKQVRNYFFFCFNQQNN